MRTLVGLVPLLLSALLALSAAAQRIGDLERHSFGEVAQGTVVEHGFPLRNDTDQPLRISGVRLTPPMQLSRMPAVIAPGQTATLRIKLDTSKVEGEYSGKLIVRLSGGNDREFTVEGTVAPTLQVLPLAGIFISTPKGTAKSGSVEIVNREAQPLTLAIEKKPADFDVKLDTLEAGRRYRLTVTVPANAPPGRRSDRMELKTSSASKPLLFVGVHTTVRERVYTFPDSVDLGRLPADELNMPGARATAAAQTLMVYQTGGKAFRVEARSDIPGLEITAEPGAQGDRVQLTLSLTRDAKPGPVRGTLTLKTNDPQFPELRVPVSGTVLPNRPPGS